MFEKINSFKISAEKYLQLIPNKIKLMVHNESTVKNLFKIWRNSNKIKNS